MTLGWDSRCLHRPIDVFCLTGETLSCASSLITAVPCPGGPGWRPFRTPGRLSRRCGRVGSSHWPPMPSIPTRPRFEMRWGTFSALRAVWFNPRSEADSSGEMLRTIHDLRELEGILGEWAPGTD